tara:strand:+ start:1426 stop:2634 length:1209 start_codon:yes stop_codon:yes gene_type:complete
MSKNVHMEHIEDMIFNEGVNGARTAINSLRNLRDMLSGKSKSAINTTVKWDGAPAIFAGIDPSDGKFFVAKKGLFNVNPQMFKSVADIKKDSKLSGELKTKFSIAFTEFSKLGIKSGVYQGDLMFTKGDVKSEKIDGEKYFTFGPNTIVYAVPVKSRLGSQVNKARIGVVWHTTYTGKKITSMKGSFGKNISRKFKSIPSVWMQDATYSDVTGNATFNAKETEKVTALLSEAGKIFQSVPGNMLRVIENNEELKEKIKTHNNTYVREGVPFPDVGTHVSGLYKYITNWYDDKISTLKTPKGQDKWKKQKQEVLKKLFVDPESLKNVYRLMNKLIEAKSMIINKMNKASKIGTFLKTKNGFRATTPEGFVAIDKLTGGAVKLVDRLEFSRANFSPDVIKGWEK